MIWFKCLFVFIFSLQVSTRNVLSASNVTDDAQDALDLLYNAINTTTNIITNDVPNTFDENLNRISEIMLADLKNDLSNYTDLVFNLTDFANFSGGLDCFIGVLSLMKTTNLKDNEDNTFAVIFQNFLSLANVELGIVIKQFNELTEEFSSNCVQDKINCNGVSSYVVAEVDRLIRVLKKIKIDFVAEAHVLIYEYLITWKSTRVILITELNKRLENATICLAFKIENNTQEIITSTVVPPSDVKGSITDSFYDLVLLAEESYTSSISTVIFNTITLLKHTSNDYINTITNIRGAIFTANQTINILLNIAPEFNTTLDCSLPNLHAVVNSSVARALEEYTILGPDAITESYHEGLSFLNSTLNGVLAISLQVKECTEDTKCGYLVKKIAKKSNEVPLTLSSLASSISVLLYPSVMYVRESGVRIVRDVLEELEVGIVGLKSCIRSSLYDDGHL